MIEQHPVIPLSYDQDRLTVGPHPCWTKVSLISGNDTGLDSTPACVDIWHYGDYPPFVAIGAIGKINL